MKRSTFFKNSSFTDKIDTAIRFFLYLLIFWLPYSPAVVESAVVISFVLWVIKRTYVFFRISRPQKGISSFFRDAIKAFRPTPSPIDKSIIIFLAACVFSLIGAAFPEQSWRGFFTKTLEWFIIFFLVLEVFRQKRHIVVAMAVFFFTSFSLCLDGIFQFYSLTDIFCQRQIMRGTGVTAALNNYNTFGGYLTFVITPFFSLLVFKEKKWYIKVCFLGIFIVAACSLLLTLSRGAIIANICGLLFFLFFVNKKLFFPTIGILILGLSCFYLFSSLQKQERLRLNPSNIQDTAGWRKDVWVDSLKMIKDKPVFGHGVNSYMRLFQEYRQKTDGGASYSPTYAHNCYIQVAAETGLAGLLSLLWMFFRLLRVGVNFWRSSPEDGNWRFLFLGLLAGALAYLLHSFVDTHFYSLQISALFWYMAGMIVAIYQIGSKPALVRQV